MKQLNIPTLISILFMPLSAILAQNNDCYNKYLNEGIKHYKDKKYELARSAFDKANGCPNRSKFLTKADSFLRLLSPRPGKKPPGNPQSLDPTPSLPGQILDTDGSQVAKNILTPEEVESKRLRELREVKKQDSIRLADETRRQLQVKEDSTWSIVDDCRTLFAYKCFVDWYPHSKYRQKADDYILNIKKTKPQKPDTKLVKKKSFKFGPPSKENEFNDQRPTITVPDQYVGVCEVTNAEFCLFLNEMGDTNAGGIPYIDLNGNKLGQFCRIRKKVLKYIIEEGYDDFPVIFVTWYGANAYCQWLNTKHDSGYHLPSEALMDYIAQNPEIETPDVKEIKNIKDIKDVTEIKLSDLIPEINSKDSRDKEPYIAKCATFKPNRFNLYHVIGNVAEWCADNWVEDVTKLPTKGEPYSGGNNDKRTVKGGAWNQPLINCYYNNRIAATANEGFAFVGFRIVAERL